MIAWLSISCYAGTLGGEHFRGRLIVPRGSPYDVDVMHPLSRAEAVALNKKEGAMAIAAGAGYKPGKMSGRFQTLDGLLKWAPVVALETWPGLEMIVRGPVGGAPPVSLVWCKDDALAQRVDALLSRSQEIYAQSNDPWSIGHGDEMDRIIDAWVAIEERLMASMLLSPHALRPPIPPAP